MSFREDFIYWRIAQFFITQKNYQIITMSRDQNEIWLENLKNKEYPIIRLRRYDIDWANWINKDLQLTVLNGEKIKKSLLKRHIKILNIYVSSEPPVDSYEMYFSNVARSEKQNVSIRSLLIEGSNLSYTLEKLNHFVGESVIPYVKSDYEQYEMEAVRSNTLQFALKKEKEDRQTMQQSKPFFTYVFIAIQVLVFLIMEFVGGSRNPNVLILFGAKFNPFILMGEWWRLITPMFIHIGFAHVLLNSIALYYLGSAVEQIYGKVRFLIIYFFAGFMGTLLSFIVSPVLSAGASGAIYGMFGALLYFGLMHPRPFFRTMGMNIISILVINLILTFMVPGIDIAGHIGGLIGGFLAAAFVHLPKDKKISQQLLALLASVVLSLIGLYIGFNFPRL